MGINRLSASLLTLLVSEVGAAEPAQVDLYGHIEANYRILEKAERDFRALHGRGHLSSSESEDYEAYLNRLRDRLAHDCAALGQTTGRDKSFPAACTRTAERNTAGAASVEGKVETESERTAGLDAELGTKLGVFDEMLLREQERIKAAAAGTGAGGSAAGGDGADSGEVEGEKGDASEDSGDQTSGEDEISIAESSTDDQQKHTSQGSLGKTHRPASEDTPADIPDGSDDDLVARQLREAAEKERDPELKKRLWDEYRKYKQGTR